MHYITAFEFPYISFNHPQILQTLYEEVNGDKLEWAELNQAETVRLQVYAKLCFQV